MGCVKSTFFYWFIKFLIFWKFKFISFHSILAWRSRQRFVRLDVTRSWFWSVPKKPFAWRWGQRNWNILKKINKFLYKLALLFRTAENRYHPRFSKCGVQRYLRHYFPLTEFFIIFYLDWFKIFFLFRPTDSLFTGSRK